MNSPSAKQEHDGSAEKVAGNHDEGLGTTGNGNLERLQTAQEGEMLTQDAEAAKREWIKTAPESPRNWPLWRKWWIISGLLFYTIVIFICNTGFVTDDAEEGFGVNKEAAVMGQSLAWSLTFRESLHDKVYEKHTGIKQKKSATAIVSRELGRAAILLCTEPIVMALALTTTFLFGLIFIYLQGYTFVYGDHFALGTVAEGAMFLVSILGGFIALVTQPVQNYLYRRSAKSTSNGKPRPEARLYTACFAVWIMLISVFWFAFTSSLNPQQVSYQAPMWSGLLFGYAEVAIYTGLWQYGTDAYGANAGSALAAINLPANSVACGLAHAALPFFENVADKWALGIMGFISILYLAVPPLLVWKGQWLRKRSPFAMSRDAGAADD
ncbi:MAG: hypothetical protein Q9218_005223 [Villophora microphyllina]